jgi:hypothetical protein
MTSGGERGKPSFAQNVTPMFRTKDRDAMMEAFDLFDYADVADPPTGVR